MFLFRIWSSIVASKENLTGNSSPPTSTHNFDNIQMSAYETKEFRAAADNLVNAAMGTIQHALGPAGILLTTLQNKGDYEGLRATIRADELYVLERGIKQVLDSWNPQAKSGWSKFKVKFKEAKKAIKKIKGKAEDCKEFRNASDGLVNAASAATGHLLESAGILLSAVEAKGDYEALKDVICGDETYVLERGVKQLKEKWGDATCKGWDKFMSKLKETKCVIKSSRRKKLAEVELTKIFDAEKQPLSPELSAKLLKWCHIYTF
ncbi:hypothetical protein AAMO2058_000634200 [Amorphochlora amoebiformis]